ncbi:hypothetical protein [Cellulomonas triticagri]|uniref:Uncharacterized protein n=1 Tax=Cellulomonas triticagri TaxID=2483352 RepID=A0A3M2JQ99_9CELL|nr:hypothetical protein [Cellulomonas triticagri]RMI13813.1 hypothetical protein EBM89_02965 [Cellulomonas triticagri]
MLPEAPSSDYLLLTLIIAVTGGVPYAVMLVAPVVLRHRREATEPRRTAPAWVLVAVPVLLVAWWFAAAWLFLAD